MNLGILVPLKHELRSLTTKNLDPGSCVALSSNITVCLSGVGHQATRAAFTKILEHPVDLVVSWGTAAGLTHGVRAGDLVIPKFVKTSEGTFQANPWFCQQIASCIPSGLKKHHGTLSDTGTILRSIDDKRKLNLASNCVTADMESGAIARLAEEHNLPFAVIRSVSDEVTTPIPTAILNSFKGNNFEIKSFIYNAIITPSDWKDIFKLSGEFKKARKSLRTAARILISHSDGWNYPGHTH